MKIHLEKKLKALDCYDSQKNKSYFDESFIRSLARVRGMEIWEHEGTEEGTLEASMKGATHNRHISDKNEMNCHTFSQFIQ